MLTSLLAIAALHWAILVIPGFNFILVGQLAAGESRAAAMSAAARTSTPRQGLPGRGPTPTTAMGTHGSGPAAAPAPGSPGEIANRLTSIVLDRIAGEQIGLERTAEIYGVAVIVLALSAAASLALRRRRDSAPLPTADEDATLSDQNVADYNAAVDALLAGRWSEALELLHKVPAKDRAKDFLTIFIVQNNYEPPPKWDGVIPMPSK